MIQGGVVLHGNPLLPERHFGCLSLKHFNSRLRPDWLNRDTLKCSQLFSKRIQQLHWTTHKFCILHLSQFVFCIWAGPQTKDIGGHSRLVCTRVDQISTKFSGVASALITPRYIAVYFAANNIFFPYFNNWAEGSKRHWIGIHKTLWTDGTLCSALPTLGTDTWPTWNSLHIGRLFGHVRNFLPLLYYADIICAITPEWIKAECEI